MKKINKMEDWNHCFRSVFVFSACFIELLTHAMPCQRFVCQCLAVVYLYNVIKVCERCVNIRILVICILQVALVILGIYSCVFMNKWSLNIWQKKVLCWTAEKDDQTK